MGPTQGRLEYSVSFEEASTVFADPLAIVVEDAQHPERILIVGESLKARVLATVFTEVHEDETRIISARRGYENGQDP